MILARKYSNGLILYRTNIWSGFHQNVTNMIDIELNDTYRVINYDGSLGDVITSATLMPYQGLILKKHVETTTATPKTTTTPILTEITTYTSYETTAEITTHETQQTELQNDDSSGNNCFGMRVWSLAVILFNIFVISFSFL